MNDSDSCSWEPGNALPDTSSAPRARQWIGVVSPDGERGALCFGDEKGRVLCVVELDLDGLEEVIGRLQAVRQAMKAQQEEKRADPKRA